MEKNSATLIIYYFKYRFIYDYGIENDLYKERDVNFVYNLSMFTTVDEDESTKHLYMSFSEFIEALCRIAEIMSLPPPKKYYEQFLIESPLLNYNI